MAPLLLALQLLTRLPIPNSTPFSPDLARQAQAWFPWIGLLSGSLMAGPLLLADPHLPNLAPLLAILAPILLTGAMHEDAVADSADALFGGSSPEKRVEILKDSRLGTFGSIALWFLLAARFLVTRDLYANLPPLEIIEHVLFAHIAARTLATIASHICTPRTQTDNQRTALFTGRLSSAGLLISSLPISTFLAVNPRVAAPLPLALLATILVARLYINRIGALRGDALGCIIALSETLLLTRPESLL